jgi:sigma-E factor negative regulatory protein RseA
MNNIEDELISALLDGEIDPEKHQNTVSRLLDAGPDSLDTFGRYRLIGDLMRDETALVTHVADEVHARLRDEPTVLVPPPPSPWRWLRPAAGLAVAASVAAAAIVVAPQLLSYTDPTTRAVAVPPSDAVANAFQPRMITALPSFPGVTAASSRKAERGDRWQALDADLEDRLNRLVIEHHEFAGRSGLNGPVPHIGFVSYDER